MVHLSHPRCRSVWNRINTLYSPKHPYSYSFPTNDTTGLAAPCPLALTAEVRKWQTLQMSIFPNICPAAPKSRSGRAQNRQPIYAWYREENPNQIKFKMLWKPECHVCFSYASKQKCSGESSWWDGKDSRHCEHLSSTRHLHISFGLTRSNIQTYIYHFDLLPEASTVVFAWVNT